MDQGRVDPGRSLLYILLVKHAERAQSWTGGQYSLVRVVLASWLGVHAAARLVTTLTQGDRSAALVATLAVAGSLALALGAYDRVAAFILAWLLVAARARGEWRDLSLAFVVASMLVHLALPPAAYGSWAARDRVDPAGEWRFPPWLYRALWITFVALHLMWIGRVLFSLDLPEALARWGRLSPEGAERRFEAQVLACLQLPLLLALALPRIRVWAWLALGGADLVHLVLFPPSESSALLLWSWAASFAPAFVPGVSLRAEATLYYDGGCGLCHRAIRFVLAESPHSPLRFAPLQGETFAAALPPEQRATLPDSLILDAGRGLEFRSQAFLHLMMHFGGLWRLLASAARLIPARLRDAVYDGIAGIRHRLFTRPKDVCPLLPPALRQRFLP